MAVKRERVRELLLVLACEALSEHHDRTKDEAVTLCHVCHRFEEHAPRCPIPAIQEWLGAQTNA